MAYDEARYLQALQAADARAQAGDKEAEADARELAQVIHQNRTQQAPAAAPAPVEQTPMEQERAARIKAGVDEEAGNNFGQNMLAGAKLVLPDMYRGASQASAEQRKKLALDDLMGTNQPTGRVAALGTAPKANAAGRLIEAGDEERRLNTEEVQNRERNDPIYHSAGGMAGNVAANIALTAPVGLARGGMALGQGARALALGRALAAPTARAAGATGAKLLLQSAPKEAAIGALTGALTPTVEGESRADNVMLQGGMGVLGSGIGAGATSQLGQRLTDRVLATTPGFMRGALKRINARELAKHNENVAPAVARNAEEAAAYEAKRVAALEQAKALNLGEKTNYDRMLAESQQKAQAADYLQENQFKQEMDDYTALRATTEASYKEAQAAAKKEAADAMAKREADDLAEVAAKNAQRGAHQARTDADIARLSGWENGFPANRINAKAEVARVGNRLGEIVKPYPVPTDSFVAATQKAAKEWGTDSSEANTILKIGQSVHDKTDLATGKMPGIDYSKSRREIVEAMGDASGTYRQRLEDLLKHLDDAFDEVAPEDVVKTLRQTRTQYGLGHQVANMPWDAKKGPNRQAVLNRWMQRSEASGAREAQQTLNDALAALPDKAKPGKFDKILPAEVPEPQYPTAPVALGDRPKARPDMVPLPRTHIPDDVGQAPTPTEIAKFVTEKPDYGRSGLAGVIGSSTIGPTGVAGVIGAALGARALNHEPTRKLTAKLLRALNASYGHNLSPLIPEREEGESDKKRKEVEKNIRVTHGKKD